MVTTVARVGPEHHLEKASLCDLSTSHILQTLTACYKPKAIIFFLTKSASASSETPDQIGIVDTVIQTSQNANF